MKPAEFLYLSQEDVIAAGGLEMAGTLATVEEAFRLWGLGDVVQPIKSTIRWGPPPTENTRGRIIAMAAYVGGGVDTAGVNGMPINDVSEATRISRAAKAKGIGRVLRLWERPIWV